MFGSFVRSNVSENNVGVYIENVTKLAFLTRGADKYLAQTERKQARKHVRDARDFNNIETRAVINFFFPARQGAEVNSRNSDRNIILFPSWSGYELISTPVSRLRGHGV